MRFDTVRFYSCLLVLIFVFQSSPTLAQSRGSKFPGFSETNYGLGVVVGLPISVRYQDWKSFKRAYIYDLGYQTDGFIMADANYAWYLISEDDRWKVDRRVGTILYNVMLGITGGFHIGDDEDEKARLGVRAGGALEYLVPKSSFSVRVELVPVLFISGKEAAGVQGGVGLTYYFDSRPGRGVQFGGDNKRVKGSVSQEFLEGNEDFDNTDLMKEFNEDSEKAVKKKFKKRKVKKRQAKPKKVKKKTKVKKKPKKVRKKVKKKKKKKVKRKRSRPKTQEDESFQEVQDSEGETIMLEE